LGLAIVGDVLALYGTAAEIGEAGIGEGGGGGCRVAFAVPGWQAAG
jgi:hypothetical protein